MEEYMFEDKCFFDTKVVDLLKIKKIKYEKI